MIILELKKNNRSKGKTHWMTKKGDWRCKTKGFKG
jgi:hypothetical protein